MKERFRQDILRENMGEDVRGTLFMGGWRWERILLLEGSQAIPIRPFDKDRMKVKIQGDT